MADLRIGVVPGTPEGARLASDVLDGVKRLGVALRLIEFDLGPGRYRRTGELLPQGDLAALRQMDAVFVGAPPVARSGDIPLGVLDEGVVFGLRRGLGLSVNLRVFRGVGESGGCDVAVVREISEGAYIFEGGVLHSGTDEEIATQGSVSTFAAVDRCVRYALQLGTRRRGRVTLAHKPGVLQYSGALWTRVFEKAAADYPQVAARVENVDTCCADLIEHPDRYDVILADNLFGDILSDVAAAALGARHHSGSAELTAGGGRPSLFEPMHAVSGHHADAGVAVELLSGFSAAAMMLDAAGIASVGAALQRAVVACAEECLRGGVAAATVEHVVDATLFALDLAAADREALHHYHLEEAADEVDTAP